jgi:hypothetical protein
MTAAARHWHGYLWTGTTEELKKAEPQRRPITPGAVQDFLRSNWPPLQTGYYLLRRPETGRTWAEVDDVMAWIVATYQQHPPTTREDGMQAWPDFDLRQATTRDALVNGVDGWWQYSIGAGTEHVIAVIVCPHTHIRAQACPMPPRT